MIIPKLFFLNKQAAMQKSIVAYGVTLTEMHYLFFLIVG